MSKVIKSGLNLGQYNIPGRWYRIFCESDGDTRIVQSDLVGVTFTSDGLINMPIDFHAVTAVNDYNVTDRNNEVTKYALIATNEGIDTITIPNGDKYDYGYTYVFGYFK